jgi:hypothetical protein
MVNNVVLGTEIDNISSSVWVDEDICPYVVWDDRYGAYWFSPLTMGPVVIQRKEGMA